MAKKGKPKLSKVKRNNVTKNRMQKQGTNKHKRHKKQPQKQAVQQQHETPQYSESEASEIDPMDMIDEDDLEYMREQVTQNESLLSSVPTENVVEQKPDKGPKSKRKCVAIDKEMQEDEENIEEEYERVKMNEEPPKKVRHLLPIKTKEGLVQQETEQDDSEEEPVEVSTPQEDESEGSGSEEASDEDDDQNEDPLENKEAVTSADLIVARKRELDDKKYRIGTLCSGILEAPERKLRNFYPLFHMMEEKNKDGTENLISVRKLATLSLFEVFKDILPDYMIKHQDYENVKLKKDTLTLYKYEKEILDFYKRYLQRCEKAANALRPKKGDKRKINPAHTKLGLISLKCMCSILEEKPYFNFAINICQTIVPFMNSRQIDVRTTVSQTCANIFKEDKKGEISLLLVRRINHLVKSRSNNVYPEAIKCLMLLRIKDIDLDAEKSNEIKQKKEEEKKKRIINLSKKERKRKKKLREVEKELLETQAEENKLSKHKNMSEITKTVFMIYFRILKNSPESKLLSATLEGLSKFAHVINLDFYSDLVKVLRHLLEADDDVVSSRQKLHCIQTVFNILSGQGEALMVDPETFYTHLYANLLEVHAGKTYPDLPIIIDTMSTILIKRRRKISQQTLLAYVKRLCMLALQVPHNGALAALAIIRTVALNTKSVEILLDLEESCGSGHYDRYLLSPEHSGTNNTNLFELLLMRKHYHPSVRDICKHICERNFDANIFGKLSPNQLLKEYDGSEMSFKPAIPVPKKTEPKKKYTPAHHYCQPDFDSYCQNIVESVNDVCDFQKIY